MEAVVTSAMSTYNIPGVIAAVWVPNKGTWIKAFGYANKTTNETMKPDMPFRIASLTKTFTITVILQLAEEGRLNLDDTLDKYITSPAVPDANKITLRQLANMSSGLFDYTDDETFGNEQMQDPLRVWTPQELVSFSLLHPAYFAPGTSYHYSNTNYVLLGMIIEKITGTTIGTQIQGRIISPLSLSRTSFATTSQMPYGSSHGYYLDTDTGKIEDITNVDPSYGWSAGSIISNINDLKVWTEALGKGSLISANSHKEQFTWVDEPGAPISKYGLGVMKVGNFIGHEGHIDGFNSIIMYLPSNGSVFVIMQNLNPSVTAGIAGNMFIQIAKIALPNDVSW